MNLSFLRFGLLTLVVTACGCGSSEDAPGPDGGDASLEPDAGDASPPEVGGGDGSPTEVGGGDAGDAKPPDADTSEASCEPGSVDDPDDDGRDDNCDGVDGVAAFDIYVATKGLESNTGTPTEPVPTLRRALALAQERSGARVFMAKGTYEVDTVELGSDIQIIGGYDESFRGPPRRENTTLLAKETGLLVQAHGADVLLSHLTISGQDATDSEQVSRYGLRIQGGGVWIDDVVVASGDAPSGKRGEDGVDGQEANPSSSNSDPITCNGVVQDIVSAGTAQCPAAHGAEGQSGRDGNNAAISLGIRCGFLASPAGAIWGMVGYPGVGGSTCAINVAGRGGCPGERGTGGTSAGSSVAVLVLVGSFKATRSVIQTGHGGAGGDSGLGGAGAEGTTGNGYTGGKGGRGGNGGGGAGGSSIGVLYSTAVVVDIDASTRYRLGSAGPGGKGRAGAYAPSGKRLATLESVVERGTEHAPCENGRQCCDGLTCVENECRPSP